MTGEFVRAIGIADSPTTVVASCEGIYRNDNTTLVATTAIHLETECVSIDVVLTNGYLHPSVMHSFGLISRSCCLDGWIWLLWCVSAFEIQNWLTTHARPPTQLRYLNLYNVVSTCPVIGGVHKVCLIQFFFWGGAGEIV